MNIEVRAGLSPFGAALLLYAVLILPNYPGALGLRMWVSFPLEIPALLLTLMALRQGRALRFLRVALTGAITVLTLLKVADLVSFDALSRPFNPVADLFLVDAFIRLLTGTLGPILSGLAVFAAVLGICAIAALVWWATGVWSRISFPARLAPLIGGAALLAAGVALADVGARLGQWSLPLDLPGEALTTRIGVRKVVTARETSVELRNFRAAVLQDRYADRRDLFTSIDRDVVVIFVESYGRTSFDTEYYAQIHRATLARYEEQLRNLGLSMRSGFLSAPTRGGQSWLSHATLANGLWIDNQISYGAALSSGRATLFHHAGNNGFRTAAVMPQITLDWPEATRMGFETVLAAADLGYQGLAFNWVTMPDQFSLAALDRLLRNDGDDRRLFAQVALASSHAPWVPVPRIIPWDSIGDGQVFNGMATAGDPPEVVWRDRDRVRLQYRLAIDYALQAVLEYAVLHAADPPLLIIVGDHQAAQSIALDDRSDVPLHLIGPAHLVDLLSEAAPDSGLIPADGRGATPMDRMRDIILDATAQHKTTERSE